jgi:two-component sensor histidine kinase
VPARKLVHQLSSTRDPVFSLRVPASRIVGGYTVRNGVIVPNYDHGQVIEAVFRRTRVTVGLMTAAKLLSAVEPVIRYQRSRFRGGETAQPGPAGFVGHLGIREVHEERERAGVLRDRAEASGHLGVLVRLVDATGDALGRTEDAAQLALQELASQEGRRIVVLFTDGRDQNMAGTAPQSVYSAKSVAMLAREHGLPIFTIGMVTEQIHQSVEQEAVELCGYLKGLVAAVQDGLAELAEGRSVALDAGSGCVWPAKRAELLGIVMTELLTNALQYGRGAVQVRFFDIAASARLEVNNHDVLPPSAMPAVQARGTGLRIAAALLREQGGALTVHHTGQAEKAVAEFPWPSAPL